VPEMKKSCFALVKSSWDHRRVFFDINAGSVVIVCSVCAQVRREQLLTKLHVSILHDMRPIFIIKSCPSPNLQVKYYLNVKNKKKSLSNLFLESLISHTHIIPLHIAAAEFPGSCRGNHCVYIAHV